MSDTGRPGPTGPGDQPSRPAWAQHAPSSPAEPPADGPSDRRRPRWLLPVAVGVAVLVVAGVVTGVLLSRDGERTPAATASTVLLPSPTPTVAPSPRAATTAFASALPASVLQYALATSEEDAEAVGAGALEAWTETYTDGGDGTLTVRAAQFETPEEAAAYAASLVGALPTAAPSPSATSQDGPALPATGEVQADGAAVGSYTIADAGDGTGVAVWQNGTAVLRLTAPVGDVADAYAAFPL
ncbi:MULTISPECIES: hypothetical protein [Cellulomonas]|uniref:hypothetical protein n=1 Tax=Cellulomonas TaxID=1707 RepID=UPI0010A7DA56|nr:MULTISPECIES: hypothetical protein [Cellulomonas]